MFKVSQPKELEELLKSVEEGKLQLPDFQRGWVWDDDHICDLLASVSRGFPIGVIMTLDANSEIKFKPRPIEGAEENGAALEEFLLDGQQRITSLYQSVFSSNPVETTNSRGQEISRYYYIDIKRALDSNTDREEAIFSVPKDRIITRNFGREIELDLSNPEKEYHACMFPVNQIFDDRNWMRGYQRFWESQASHPEGNANRFYDKFYDNVIKSFTKYTLPVISMTKKASREAVCTVFEKMNTGAVVLTVFELVTASFAAEPGGFELRKDWEKRQKRMSEKYDTLKNVTPDQFLQAIALLTTQKNDALSVGCKRRDILNLSLADYKEWAKQVQDGLIKAAEFLRLRCSIYIDKNIPYRTQLVPLAAFFVEMGDELESDNAKRKLEHWFWCGVFNESYGGTTETLFSRDLRETPAFIRGGSEPTLIREANFIPERLLSLRRRNSAAYKGLYALQLKSGAADWRKGEQIAGSELSEGQIDIHHIFPSAWIKKHRPGVFSKKTHDSIINKTPIDAKTNRMISGNAPSVYLARLAGNDITPMALDNILKKHWIDPDNLKKDKFSEFFVKRGQALLDLIGRAMRKDLGNGEEVFRREVNDSD